METCKECKKNPVAHLKRQLCEKCYIKLRYNGQLEPLHYNLYTKDIKILTATEKKYQHIAEIAFVQCHPEVKLIYQPVAFNLGNEKYIPDFYDPENNVFYEIVGSRQRHFQNKLKIKKAMELFPKIQIKVVCPNWEPYNSYGEKKR